jgi:hypothetical protein
MTGATREDISEALKVPAIAGRGDAYGIVIGNKKLHDIAAWSPAYGVGLAKQMTSGDGMWKGMRVIVTTKFPDTLFAVTAQEYAGVKARLESDSNDRSACAAWLTGISRQRRQHAKMHKN